ncbi:putative membrane-anchored protein [Rhizobium mongolense]|uniref:Membrane-anchored protein n=2 Tax=Rhizobium mongolense TaxID=57676 RepID=A0A7W6RTS9_9HYPH|nr:putative membrane-anchored protein [Rhizobium mongolense]MBB4278499.1 putative membrane-anchored protein [Rhizobium mongolense]
MMALPLAQSLSPEIRRIEASLTAVTQRMKQHARDEADQLLAEITRLAAELEANAAMSLYRFGASRAYYEIVQERIRALAETATSGSESLGAFLERRLAPAMRTCQSIEERQANLSRKLARATSLLRSWIDVELERINMTLLNSMDRRAKMQLRLQQTVEGLSVAAISYYVVGLIGYVAKGVHLFGIEFGSEIVTAISVPVVVLGISLIVRNIRHRHSEEGDTQ